MVPCEALDADDVSESLEFASWDSYPTGFAQELDDPSADELVAGNPDQVGFNHDLYRSAGDGPFWVMEQQPGDINWPPYSPQPADGSVRLWAHHAVGHGADNVVYFRWRRCLEGQEQYHSGLLERDDTPGRGYDEARTAASELSTLPTDGAVDADVALLHDYENLWATGIQPNSPDFDYFDHQQTYYGALRSYGVDVDIVHPNTDLSGYSAVIAPTLYLVDDELAERLAEYVAGGGQLCVSIRSGVKDRANKLLESRPPGPFAELVGATVEEHESRHPSQAQSVTYEGGRTSITRGTSACTRRKRRCSASTTRASRRGIRRSSGTRSARERSRTAGSGRATTSRGGSSKTCWTAPKRRVWTSLCPNPFACRVGAEPRGW
jgi:beta-galactosidase